ncbi:MAG: 1-deoxy-D-xylulose-5-phosphate reductoisomerase [Clostridia bacterium]|nr:1-deoxy-D-xylulose-5-phosphate reductoisomerase [Clostridia bacterium]
MARTIGILGSTGSIGTQTLEVIRELNSRPETMANPHYTVKVLTCGANRELLLSQAREFRPEVLCTGKREDADWLREELAAARKRGEEIDPGVNILYGDEGLTQAAAMKTDITVTAIVGMRGLRPTLTAIGAGNDIALANKETLVAGGSIVMRAAREKGVRILPVDSEHSAVFQCLESAFASGRNAVEKLILTASGGPFRSYTPAQLEAVTPAEALRHPTWKMGGKITVDCATMMNKGLEVIEAAHLFGLPPERIDVRVHPQSIVHSMVEFIDGSVMAQLGNPDMKVPIQLALTWPFRARSETKRLDLAVIGQLTFERPRTDAFPCLALAYRALGEGGVLPAVLNGANEAAVESFLKGRLGFTGIPAIIEAAMNAFPGDLPAGADNAAENNTAPELRAVLAADNWAREYVRRSVL